MCRWIRANFPLVWTRPVTKPGLAPSSLNVALSRGSSSPPDQSCHCRLCVRTDRASLIEDGQILRPPRRGSFSQRGDRARVEAAMATAGALPSGNRAAETMPARDIRFRDLSFAYPGGPSTWLGAGAPVLDRFDRTIPAGSSFAMSGRTAPAAEGGPLRHPGRRVSIERTSSQLSAVS